LILPNGEKVFAKARAQSFEEEVLIEWSGATHRIEPIVRGKYSVDFLQWYFEARARQLNARFDFKTDTVLESR
jgi:hypothetical protein